MFADLTDLLIFIAAKIAEIFKNQIEVDNRCIGVGVGNIDLILDNSRWIITFKHVERLYNTQAKLRQFANLNTGCIAHPSSVAEQHFKTVGYE